MDVSKQAEAIVGRRVVRFTQPLRRISAKVSVDAPLTSNGVLSAEWNGLKVSAPVKPEKRPRNH
jgi:hypothetical protein